MIAWSSGRGGNQFGSFEAGPWCAAQRSLKVFVRWYNRARHCTCFRMLFEACAPMPHVLCLRLGGETTFWPRQMRPANSNLQSIGHSGKRYVSSRCECHPWNNALHQSSGAIRSRKCRSILSLTVSPVKASRAPPRHARRDCEAS